MTVFNILLFAPSPISLFVCVGLCLFVYMPNSFPMDHRKLSSDIEMLHPKILHYASSKNCLLQNFQSIKVALTCSLSPKDLGLLYLVGRLVFSAGVSALVGTRCQVVASGCSQGPATRPAFYRSPGSSLHSH